MGFMAMRRGYFRSFKRPRPVPSPDGLVVKNGANERAGRNVSMPIVTVSVDQADHRKIQRKTKTSRDLTPVLRRPVEPGITQTSWRQGARPHKLRPCSDGLANTPINRASFIAVSETRPAI